MVLCAPLFEEKLWSHRVMVNLARFLAQQGVSVLRFDYFGDGESQGRFADATVASRVADIHDAVEFCRRETGIVAIHVLGLCYGANLALSAALTSDSISGTVAWAPVMDGERYVGELLRAHLTTQMVVHRKIIHDREALVRQIMDGQSVNVEGYEIGRELYQQLISTDGLAQMRAFDKELLIQQISPQERVEAQYAALTHLGNQRLEFQAVREVKFWTQQKSVFPPCSDLFARTDAWLQRVSDR